MCFSLPNHMKILYAIQGAGNGHLSRAKDIYTELLKYGEVDILVSGLPRDIQLTIPVTYQLHGLSFVNGKHGSISSFETLKRFNPFRFLKDVYQLPVKNYALVVNDFEPVSAWACKLRGLPCIALSHQSAIIHNAVPKVKKQYWFENAMLKYYAPYTGHYGFHFLAKEENTFFPVIRKEVQELEISTGKHYTVYLPAYDVATIVRFLSKIKKINWQVFCKHTKEAFQFENIMIEPVDNNAFLQSLASCKGALLGAGFEAPAEALYLGKKVMVIPMTGQVVQQHNAAALTALGVPSIPALHSKYLEQVNEWILNEQTIQVPFLKETAALAVQSMMHDFLNQSAGQFDQPLSEFI